MCFPYWYDIGVPPFVLGMRGIEDGVTNFYRRYKYDTWC